MVKSQTVFEAMSKLPRGTPLTFREIYKYLKHKYYAKQWEVENWLHLAIGNGSIVLKEDGTYQRTKDPALQKYKKFNRKQLSEEALKRGINTRLRIGELKYQLLQNDLEREKKKLFAGPVSIAVDPLSSLNEDTFVFILSKLSIYEVCSSMMVCKNWSKLCRNPYLWKSLFASTFPDVEVKEGLVDWRALLIDNYIDTQLFSIVEERNDMAAYLAPRVVNPCIYCDQDIRPKTLVMKIIAVKQQVTVHMACFMRATKYKRLPLSQSTRDAVAANLKEIKEWMANGRTADTVPAILGPRVAVLNDLKDKL